MSMGLTPRQAEILAWLRADPSRCDLSLREMTEAMGLASHSTIVRVLARLEASGYIRRLPGRDRSIELLTPIGGGLRLVHGADHWDRRAALKRSRWQAEQSLEAAE